MLRENGMVIVSNGLLGPIVGVASFDKGTDPNTKVS